MKIDTTMSVTVRELLARLEGADPNAVLEFVRTPKKDQVRSCWCGCGQATKSRFVPGHDSRFHGMAKRVARGEEAMPETWACDEAKADFLAWVEAERPLHEARMREKARAKALKEVARLEREAAKREEAGEIVEMVEIDEETAAALDLA